MQDEFGSLLEDLKEVLDPNKKKDIILSDDEDFDSNFVEEDLKDSAPPEEESEDDYLMEDNEDDTLFDDDIEDDSEKLEPKKFDKNVVMSLLTILRENGYMDASFDKSKGFIWNYVPAHSYLTLEFGDKFNENKSFYIITSNKLEITEDALKDADIVTEILRAYQEEYNNCSKILMEMKKVYPIVN